MESEPEIIDLTDSFTYTRAPINFNSVLEIDLDDSLEPDPVIHAYINSGLLPRRVGRERDLVIPEPIHIECDTDVLPPVNVDKSKATSTKKRSKTSTPKKPANQERERSPHLHLGDCPICRDPLGSRPTASTICGHIYCIPCIEQSVKIEKKCPTCRKPLKGLKSYHPLYL